MGGKSKKASRTKDNARPSSSSHCAELLGNNIPVFFDFTTAKDSFFGTTEELNQNIDTNFQIVLKKMSKKDSITKLKALQEFTDLCNNSDAETVKAILPFWPRLYCSLAIDVEHRMREAAHIAHGAIVGKARKSIAPYLKQLVGPWFISQYDNYPPAASAAALSFEQVFPLEKQNKVIEFCQEKILEYIYESLIQHTPVTLSNTKITKPEEMEARYERVVIASLQGYNLYLQKMSCEQIKEAEGSNKKIISSAKFWEYSKNKVPLIRNSFFHVLISLSQNAKFLLDGEMKRVTVAIFNDFDDSDPMVMTSVWDAALNALVFLNDCWSHVNFEKQVFPKLNSIIKKGGRNAIVIFPSVLPLLSKIPPDLIKDKTIFYQNLFQNMRLMMETSSTMNISYSDGRTIAVTFIECLKYVIAQNSEDISFCHNLISGHLILALEKRLSTKKSDKSPITIALYSETSQLLRSWHSNSLLKRTNYDSMLELFWDLLLRAYEKLLLNETSNDVLSDTLDNQMELLDVLQNAKKHSVKPKGRLKFADDNCDIDEVSLKEKDEGAVKDDNFEKELLPFAKKVAALYFKYSVEFEEQLSVYIPILSRLVKLFDSKAILDEYLKVRNESKLYSLFSKVFCKWMENRSLRTRDLVDLSFSLLLFVNEGEKELILQKFCKDWSTDNLQCDIYRSLLQYSNDDCVKSWILSKEFSNHLLETVRNVIDSNDESAIPLDIITTFLASKDSNEENIVPPGIASSIMDLVSQSLLRRGNKNHVRRLAQSLIANVGPKVDRCREALEQLVVALYKLSCYRQDDDIMKSCTIGLRIVLNDAGPDFMHKVANAIAEIIFSDGIEFSVDDIVSRIDYFIDAAIDCKLTEFQLTDNVMEKAIKLMKHFLKEPVIVTRWRQGIEKCCLAGYLGAGLWDLKFLELKEKKVDVEFNDSLTHSDANLNKILQYFESHGSLLKSGDVDYDILRCILYYYQFFTNTKTHFRISNDDLTKEELEICPNILTKFVNWNIYVGKLLNLLVSAQLLCFQTSLLGEKQYPGDEELQKFNARNSDTNVSSITITKEEMNDSVNKFNAPQDKWKNGRHEEKLTVIPVCGEIFDFTFSMGLLTSFSYYYAGTKYYRILKESTSSLKKIGCDLLANANTLENLFCFHSYQYFFTEISKWRMIQPIVQNLFCRNFKTSETVLEIEYVRDFIRKEITGPPNMDGNALLKMFYILQGEHTVSITENEWNLIFIYLHKFFEICKFEADTSEGEMTTLSMLSRITLQLMTLFEQNHLRPMESRLSPEACLAWNEVARKELWNQFFVIWGKLAERWHDKNMCPEMLIAIENLSEVVISGANFSSSLPGDKVKLAVEYSNYITSSNVVFQLTSYQLLLRLVADLVELDSETFCETLSKITEDVTKASLKTSSGCEWTCKKLEKAIFTNQGIVETLLSDFVIGDCCGMEPFTDSFNYTFSYLLLWCFLLEMCGQAHSSLRFQYGFWLRDKGYSNCLLESIFKLMPQTVIHGLEPKENCQKYFERFLIPNVKEPVRSERIEQISCYVYRMFLQRLPNVIREWWGQCENKTSALVDKITSLYVSPLLIANELKSVHLDRGESFDNMEIKTHQSAREVVASYMIDEVKMDLIMTLPQNYPLGTIKVESSNVVLSTSSRRNWLFHISKYLIHQNGTIWEALVMWKNNLDKKFEGVEECYICASILQGSNFETPRVSCQMCKKKFHSHCLYKWFSTSNNSTCPICRNLF